VDRTNLLSCARADRPSSQSLPERRSGKDAVMTTPRDLVYQTLDFAGPQRVARHLWTLPWAEMHYPGAITHMQVDFPNDIVGAPHIYKTPPRTYGDQYETGTYTDEWGSVFTSFQRGVIGEVKHPLIKGENWEDSANLRLPVELLSVDTEIINAFCRNSDKFVTGGANVNPFERMQWIRGSEQLYVDIALQTPGMYDVLRHVHSFNCDLLSLLASTQVDALCVFDDWGAQRSLLINPKQWVEVWKPLYKDYVDIAHSHGKRLFMHSDGYTLDILPHLIDLGVDAANLQLFCIGLEQLRPFRGEITFWGEIDRQYLLVNATPDEVEQAVIAVRDTLWAGGGCIAQCEFGAGAKPANVYKVFETWNRIVS
jgi:uroporphyrinogen decarboxylase